MKVSQALNCFVKLKNNFIYQPICSRPEQLGLNHFYDKNLEHFQQNFEHREFWILADLDSASKVGKSMYPFFHPPTGHKEFNIYVFGFFFMLVTRDHHFEPRSAVPCLGLYQCDLCR